MSKYLIVNADDYGRTRAISKGIREAHLRGIVTSTTAMMNYPTTVDDLQLALAECPTLGLGVHLTLTSGAPLLDPARVPTLVDARGAFLSLSQLRAAYPRVNPQELRDEWRAQIERFLKTGAALDHLDSHHHSSYFTEMALGIMLDLAGEYGAPVRQPHATGLVPGIEQFGPRLLEQKRSRTTDHSVLSFYDEGVSLDNLLGILGALAEGVTELMCHPGYVDDEILGGSSYNRQRERELAVLTDPEVRRAVQAGSITLADFRTALNAA
jgi:predicted glycoside hydrolase/deacetylase ChbG (UPF0249 family)